MENWRLEKDQLASSSRGSVVQADLQRTASGARRSFSKQNGTDVRGEDARRGSEWKPILSLVPSQTDQAYNGRDEETLRNSLAALRLVNVVEEPTSDRNIGGLNEATVAEQIAREAALENRECFAEDVIRVWVEISKFIISHIKSGYGVQIPGLCTITIQEERIPVPDSPYFEIRRTPLMILSRAVVHMYKLANFDEYTYKYKFSSVPLNLTDIASKLQAPRRIIEGVVTEVLQVCLLPLVRTYKIRFRLELTGFRRCSLLLEPSFVASGSNFHFRGLGSFKLRIASQKMRFYHEFCAKLAWRFP